MAELKAPEETPGTPENLRELARLLAGWRCCGAPNLCNSRCVGDETTDILSWAERVVRERLETSGG